MTLFKRKKEKWYLVEDISAWIRQQTSNPNDGLKDGERISRHDLDAIWRAIESRSGLIDSTDGRSASLPDDRQD
jgi:MoxR-like ATPase